ncbi:hypothetical protein [Nocardioides antri]|uniref:Twin-arginine translocation signal domain-containing protein n=1 Tax=Nocardioides antri TaxID=2607659 RepID=A0A5B1M7X8_9ACTN|nr:hypothetical protein [Nocardioides antri]KAA1428903.1 hypothetical protein F0U47_01405 [Nocardioides antri]
MPTPASRRAVLAGTTAAGAAALAAAAAGCGLVREDEQSAGAVDTTAPAVDADSDLVSSVAEQLAETLSLVLSTGASVRPVRPLTRRFAALHRAHLDELGQSGDVSAGRVAGSPATARARLLRAEERLQAGLARAALKAESGALAQVFASMAAAVAQERAVAR